MTNENLQCTAVPSISALNSIFRELEGFQVEVSGKFRRHRYAILWVFLDEVFL